MFVKNIVKYSELSKLKYSVDTARRDPKFVQVDVSRDSTSNADT